MRFGIRRWLALCLLCLTALLPTPEIDAARRGPHLCGRQAITSLGADVDAVAGRNRRSAAKMREQLEHDRSLCVDKSKRLYYVDTPAPPRRPGAEARVAAAPFPLSNTFKLHSKAGAAKTIFLDFDGQVLTGTAWNASTGEAVLTVPPFNAPDTDDPATFSVAEQTAIQGIWQRVAEDFIPFDVDVTTEYPGEAALTRADTGDAVYGVRVLFAGFSQAQVDALFGPAGGLAYVGSFNDVGDYFKAALVFSNYLGPYDEKAVAEAASHEAGHTLGLDHDGRSFPAEEYYEGHGTEPVAWAPIMGVGYYNSVVQWSKGEYANANNTQDDIAIIAGMTGYRTDDHVDAAAGATPLGAVAFGGTGIIGTAADQDVFSFVSAGGPLSLRVQPATPSPNLDIQAELFDAGGTLVALASPLLELGAVVDVPVTAGSYYLRVSGVGLGTATTGWSDYASLGQYTVGRVLPSGVGGRNLRIGVGSAVLTWDSGTTQTAYYLLRTAIGPGTQTSFGPLSATATSYTDTTTTPGTLYCYLLLPFDTLGILATSDMVCALTGVTSGSVVPAGLTLALNQSTIADLQWAPPPGGADAYVVVAAPLNGQPASTIPVFGGATSATHDTNGGPVCYLVAGVRGGGAFGVTDVLCAVPGTGTLAANGAGLAQLAGESLQDVSSAMDRAAGLIEQHVLQVGRNSAGRE